MPRARQSKLELGEDESTPDWAFEREAWKIGYYPVAGVDEAGRGPLAGPVIAAAVILPETFECSGLTDSKKLKAKVRQRIRDKLQATPGVVWAVGEGTIAEIEKVNILQATFLAMRRAVEALVTRPEFLLIDGNKGLGGRIPEKAVVKGDTRSFSIAAASIIAKEYRDAMMVEADADFPAYGFAKHKGYGTAEHRAAIEEYGPCPLHRRTFLGT